MPYLEAIFREEKPRLQGAGNENYWGAPFVMTVAAALLRITGDEKRLVPVLLHDARSQHDNYSVLGDLAAEYPWAMSALLEALRSSDRSIQSEAIEGAGSGRLRGEGCSPGTDAATARTWTGPVHDSGPAPFYWL